MIKKTSAPGSDLFGIDTLVVICKPAFSSFHLLGIITCYPVRAVTGLPPVDRLAHVTITLVIMHCNNGSIDRNLMKVRATQTD
ncbi:hypothetical protein D3C85_1025750 [compost metagenome]